MQISIRQRYKPFSHKPGLSLLLPGTLHELTFYPTRIEGIEVFEFSIQGPVEGFTVLLDLEKGEIVVFGKAYSSFYRYYIQRAGDAYSISQVRTAVSRGVPFERLALGVHKKQEWEALYARRDIEEFIPLWYHFSQWYPDPVEVPPHSLMQTCFDAVEAKDKLTLSEAIKALFTAGFSDLLFPQSFDKKFLGYPLEPLGQGVERTHFLSLSRKLIRSLFFVAEGSNCTFLPLVPKEIHCGRFLHIQEEGISFNFEWTKREPRRLFVEIKEPKERNYLFPKEIKEFRIKSLHEPWIKKHKNRHPLFLEPGRYLFDQFKK